MRSVRCHRLDPTYSRSEQRATRPPPPCAPTPQGPSAPSSKTLTRPGLRGACGSSAPGSLATDSGLDFHSDWSPGSSCVSGSARSFCPFWFATSQSARTGLPRLGPLLLLPPPPVARGEGGDTDWGGGKGGGEARRSSGPAGRGRRAVPRARGPVHKVPCHSSLYLPAESPSGARPMHQHPSECRGISWLCVSLSIWAVSPLRTPFFMSVSSHPSRGSP